MEITGNVNEVTKKRREVIVRGVLSVTVISAEDLPVVDLMGKADPFVTLTMKKSEMRNKTRVKASFQTMNNFFFSSSFWTAVFLVISSLTLPFHL